MIVVILISLYKTMKKYDNSIFNYKTTKRPYPYNQIDSEKYKKLFKPKLKIVEYEFDIINIQTQLENNLKIQESDSESNSINNSLYLSIGIISENEDEKNLTLMENDLVLDVINNIQYKRNKGNNKNNNDKENIFLEL